MCRDHAQRARAGIPGVELDSWRYRCPRGHTDFDVEHGAIYCHSCNARGWPSYHRRVRDEKTGEEIDLRGLTA